MAFTNMIVYRIAKEIYLNDISGTGAKLYGGRWNKEGLALLYTSQTLSLAVLELLANQVRRLVDDTYGYIAIEIPDSYPPVILDESDLPPDWRQNQYSEFTINTGSTWINSQESVAMAVPSAVLSQENNILINPSHPSFKKVKILSKGKLNLDGRIAVAST